MTSGYRDAHRRSLEDPEGFWAEAAGAIDWFKGWDKVLDTSQAPSTRWFVGGELNTCHNAVDRHVAAGRGAQAAIIYDSPVTGSKQTITYRSLQERTALFAGALADAGVKKGDRVLIYMPMVPETVVAMLGTARLGAIHSVVFGGFAANELAQRIDGCRPTVIVAASCGVEPGRIVRYMPLLNEALRLASHQPDRCIVFQRVEEPAPLAPGRDIDWNDAMASTTPKDCVPVLATDPLYILYTSGTTGRPKGVVRDNGGHAVALEWSMPNIYDAEPGEVYWAASDVGWVVGHSYIVYAPLLHGCTTILYEGKPVGTPDAGAFWRVIAEHGVSTLFTAPTALRAIKRDDPEAKLMAQYDMSRFRMLFLAGERCDPDTIEWSQRILETPVIDHWWQTETGWPICANLMGLEPMPVKIGSASLPVPGYDVRVLDEGNREVAPGTIGALSIKLPLPPSCLPTLWENHEGFVEAYMKDHPGYYKTGDAGYIDEDGYVFVMTRTDDIINVAGHRLSTGAMEEVLAGHPDVAECAVVGVADAIKGQVPVGFMVLKSGVTKGEAAIAAEAVAMVRDRIGPVAAFKTAIVVDRLPKTRSGKILRGTMQKIADGGEITVPATIDDPAILEEIRGALKPAGYAKD